MGAKQFSCGDLMKCTGDDWQCCNNPVPTLLPASSGRPAFASRADPTEELASRSQILGQSSDCLLSDGSDGGTECTDIDSQVQHGGFTGKNGCHVEDMNELPECLDPLRNANMDANAYQKVASPSRLSDYVATRSHTVQHRVP